MIQFKNVHKHFKDLHVINGISLEIKKGEVVVVCGPSGSGKSTLIRTVNQLETIESGEIWVHDTKKAARTFCAGSNRTFRCRYLGYPSQHRHTVLPQDPSHY